MYSGKFYKELGKLLYAIAKADGVVQKKEWDKFKEIISSKIVPLDDATDSYGTDKAFYAEFEFEGLEELDVPAELAYESFREFLKDNKKGLDEQTRQVLLQSVNEIANSYRGVNQKEAEMLNRIYRDLDSIGK
ncbi:MAG: TerB family tellurite resistance protein [Cytophagaceae bacterium]